MSDEVGKRMTKNLFCDSRLTIELGYKDFFNEVIKLFLAKLDRLDGQTRLSHKMVAQIGSWAIVAVAV